MATYASGSLSLSGFTGVDVDFSDMVDKLYKIESRYAEQLVSWHSDWEIRLSAFDEVRSSLKKLQTALTSINSTDKFLVKGATSSNESVLSATATSSATPGTYGVEVNQLASSSVWSLHTGLASKDALVNDSGDWGNFTYTYKGETRSLKVATGTTLEALKNQINNDGENPGVRAQLIQSAGGIVFQLSGLDTGASATLDIIGLESLNGLTLAQDPKWSYPQDGTDANGDPIFRYNELTSWVEYSSRTDAINTTETPKTFSFNVDGTDYSVTLAAGGSLDDLVAAVNDMTATTGVQAQIAQRTYGSGEVTYALHLATADPSATSTLITVGGGSLDGYASMFDTTNWQVQRGQNAELRINGWPSSGWLEVESNSASDVVEGVTFNLRAKGTSSVTVALDTKAITENVQTFVDSVNEFRKLIMDLTAVKEDSAIDPDYAENQAEMQMGSPLTGNYGIQLISSNLKQAIATGAKGFTYAQRIEEKLYGDIFNSLAQVGIITDTDESSPTFGLLVVNEETTKDGMKFVQSTGTMTLKEALEKDASAVARVFSSNGEGKCFSSDLTNSNVDFGMNSLIAGVTKPGTYEISYTVDASGNIATAYINGKAASIDNANRQIALYNHDGDDNPAGGIVLDIYNLTPGASVEGYACVRQGKVNEILDMLSGSEGILGTEGPLAHLENNYKAIMSNIKDKIQKEDTRLNTWLTRMKLRFSRLETTLANYKNLQTSIESQIKQLGGNKS